MKLTFSTVGVDMQKFYFTEGTSVREVLEGKTTRGTEIIEYLSATKRNGDSRVDEIWLNGELSFQPRNLDSPHPTLEDFLGNKPSGDISIVCIPTMSGSGPGWGTPEDQKYQREHQDSLLSRLQCPKCDNTTYFKVEGTVSYFLKEDEGAIHIRDLGINASSIILCMGCRVYGKEAHFNMASQLKAVL